MAEEIKLNKTNITNAMKEGNKIMKEIEEKPVKTGDKWRRDKNGRILPGQPSLNPAGRPEGTLSLVAILKQILAEVPEGEKETNAIILIKEAIRKARGKNTLFGGDMTMLRDIINRIDGMPKQHFEHTGAEGEPIQVNIVNYKDAEKK